MANLSPMHVITPPCRLSFPALFEPKVTFSGLPDTPEHRKFQATVLIPPDVDLKPFVAALEAAMKDKFGKVIQPKFPVIRACAGKETADGKPYAGYEDGWHFVSAKNKLAPSVVDQAMQPVLDVPRGASDEERAALIAEAENRVYAGCWCRFLLRAFAWSNQGRGVSFSLEAVQLVRDDERLGGGMVRAQDVFEPIDVGDAAPADNGSDDGDALSKLLG